MKKLIAAILAVILVSPAHALRDPSPYQKTPINRLKKKAKNVLFAEPALNLVVEIKNRVHEVFEPEPARVMPLIEEIEEEEAAKNNDAEHRKKMIVLKNRVNLFVMHWKQQLAEIEELMEDREYYELLEREEREEIEAKFRGEESKKENFPNTDFVDSSSDDDSSDEEYKPELHQRRNFTDYFAEQARMARAFEESQ